MARIVLADDEPDLVEVFAEILHEAGHEVRTALDGADALRIIREWHPDVAVLDVDMPSMSGPAIASELADARGGLETVPVMLLSGNANLEHVAAQAQVHAFLTKPIQLSEFMSELESALGGAGACPSNV